MPNRKLGLVIGTALLTTIASTAEAQILDRIGRRVERNARQLQRQVNRADYYTDQTWQSIDPWVQQNGITPLERAANTVRNTANAVAQAADAVDGRVDAQVDTQLDSRFGYRNDQTDQQWFYDYYSYTPTYYYGNANGDRYAQVIRYFDNDNDGVYDTQSRYRDSNNDGRYDEYDRIDFGVRSEGTDNRGHMPGPSDARRHRVEGEIAMTKSAQVNTSNHLIVGLKQDEGTFAIDLGPADALRGKQVEVGTSIVATGMMEEVGEKEILIAERLQIGNGETIEIDRNAEHQLSGQIVDVRDAKIGSSNHYMAIVEVEGERQLVDLGPTGTYKVRPEASTEIVLYGVPVQARKHRVFLANRVRLRGETIDINRNETFSF